MSRYVAFKAFSDKAAINDFSSDPVTLHLLGCFVSRAAASERIQDDVTLVGAEFDAT